MLFSDVWMFLFYRRKLRSIERKLNQMAQTLEDLQAAIAALGEAAAADAAQDTVVISTLQAILAKIQKNPDFTNEVSAISSAISSLTGANAAIQTELDKAVDLP